MTCYLWSRDWDRRCGRTQKLLRWRVWIAGQTGITVTQMRAAGPGRLPAQTSNQVPETRTAQRPGEEESGTTGRKPRQVQGTVRRGVLPKKRKKGEKEARMTMRLNVPRGLGWECSETRSPEGGKGLSQELRYPGPREAFQGFPAGASRSHAS